MTCVDESTEKTLLLALTTIMLKNLCDLLIEKGVITAEEYKKIIDDGDDSLQKAFMDIWRNKQWKDQQSQSTARNTR